MKMKKIAEVVANGGSLAKAIRKAGYSPRTARTPKKITKQKDYKEAIEEVTAQMKEKRMSALESITDKKLKKSAPRDLAYIADVMTKNVQLLEGKPTEINKLTADDVEERIKQLRAIGGRSKSAGDK